MNSIQRKHLVLYFFIFLFLIIIVTARLLYVMVADSKSYEEDIKDLHERERQIKGKRGEILDRYGNVLASNKTVCTISVIHSQLNDENKVIKVLSKELQMDEDEIRKKVEKVSVREKIKSNVPKETGDKIRNYNLDGVKVDED